MVSLFMNANTRFSRGIKPHFQKSYTKTSKKKYIKSSRPFMFSMKILSLESHFIFSIFVTISLGPMYHQDNPNMTLDKFMATTYHGWHYKALFENETRRLFSSLI